jgi:hypothetical protein
VRPEVVQFVGMPPRRLYRPRLLLPPRLHRRWPRNEDVGRF